MRADRLQVAPAVLADAPAIASVHIRSWRAAYAGILSAEYLAGLSEEARAARWRDSLHVQESVVLVARDEHTVVGFVSFGPCRDEHAPAHQGEILALYADPAAWRRGVGRMLLAHALVSLRATGCRQVSLWVFSRNSRGWAFYEACGFEAVAGSEQVFELGGRQLEEIKYLLPMDD